MIDVAKYGFMTTASDTKEEEALWSGWNVITKSGLNLKTMDSGVKGTVPAKVKLEDGKWTAYTSCSPVVDWREGFEGRTYNPSKHCISPSDERIIKTEAVVQARVPQGEVLDISVQLKNTLNNIEKLMKAKGFSCKPTLESPTASIRLVCIKTAGPLSASLTIRPVVESEDYSYSDVKAAGKVTMRITAKVRGDDEIFASAAIWNATSGTLQFDSAKMLNSELMSAFERSLRGLEGFLSNCSQSCLALKAGL
jgi:hypothetical protein